MANRKEQKQKCCICGNEFEGFGNNPAPVTENGRCCDDCNRNVVIPVRIEINRLLSNGEKGRFPWQQKSKKLVNQTISIMEIKFTDTENNTITGEKFRTFIENLDNEISEILNEKRVNDTAKYPDSNGECWVQIAEEVTKNCPRVQVWGFYTPENDGVTVEVWDTETNAQQRVTVCENGELSTDSLWVLLSEIAHATGANVHFSEAAGVESIQICNK